MEKASASPQNAVLQHAQSYCNKARDFDRSGDFSAAIKSYEDGLRLFHAVLASASRSLNFCVFHCWHLFTNKRQWVW
jgi:hypothetical protein